MTMKPDLPLAAAVWHDFYAVTGFAPGTDVIGCNKGARISLYEGDKPLDSVTEQGWSIPPGGDGDQVSGFRVKADAGQAWVRGNADVILGALQEFEE